MPEIPECLSRRYKALDELIQELSSNRPNSSSAEAAPTDDPGIKLMCDFWDILKENPDINLTQAVKQRMAVKSPDSGIFAPAHVSCFMAGCCHNKNKKQDSPHQNKRNNETSSAHISQASKQEKCCMPRSPQGTAQSLPLNKVLCNINEVVSFEKKCHEKISQLFDTQKQLQDQIQALEQREKDGMQLLKQADCMWSCMEESYKKKIAESLERQKELLKELKEVEASNVKWRKNKKDLEFQMGNVNKCRQEIAEKINQKSSDLKCISMEAENFKKRIESNKKDLEVAKKSMCTKKQASEAKLANIAANVSKLENILKEEQKHKYSKEQEGKQYIKEAREELQKLCKILLQKKLENEDMRAEKDALLLEIDLLNQNFDQCKGKCKNKAESIDEEIKLIDKEISDFRVRCIQCHVCTDTDDIRKFCIDCPRCVDERDCLLEGDHCSPDHSMDCVCMSIKQKFLDNVFDNMYTLLESQIRTAPGKAVAQEVMNCLKKSRNGKLNNETRKILQDFILTSVKRNLNLTIVGGAVKTRCEMDQETYNQLMLCLQRVKVTKADKADKGTTSKKEPCRRWGGSSECNCPKGPKDCICTKKGLLARSDLTPCPPEAEDKEDAGQVVVCPHKESTPCGPDCAMHALPDAVGSEVASWRPNPCQGPTCQFKNMRAAQCVLGSKPLTLFSGPASLKSVAPYSPDNISKSGYESPDAKCTCGALPIKPCVCDKDDRGDSRERIIEEVLGRYTEVTPIEKDQNMRLIQMRFDNIIFKVIFYKYFPSSNQMKVETSMSFNKATCTFSEDLPKNDIITKSREPSKDNSIAKEKHAHLLKPQPKATVNNNDTKIHDSYQISSKTSSADIKINLERNIVNLIDSKIKENSNIIIDLKETPSDKANVKREDILTLTEPITANGPRTSPSGNIKLEIHKKYKRKCSSQFIELFDNEQSKIKYKGNSIDFIEKPYRQCCSKDHLLTPKSLTKFLLNTTNEVKKKCKIQNELIKNEAIYKIKVKGVHSNSSELSFAIKSKTPGVYEIILDKEFEKWYKETIKSHEGEYEDQYATFSKSDSGHFIINFGNNNANNSKINNALLVKSYSGNIRVKVHDGETTPQSLKEDSESVLSPTAVSKLLRKLPCSKKEFKKEHERRSYINKKSSSDSNFYERVKFNLFNESNGIESEAHLKKTSSGQYNVVLDKECKIGFINNLKHYLNSGSKWHVPIKCSASGNIILNLNNDLSNNSGSLKITPSGNMFILLDKDKGKVKGFLPNTDKFSTKNVVTKSKLIQNPDAIIKRSCKAISTTCNSRCKENSCDEFKCVCKNLCYKSKKWFLESSEMTNTKICGPNSLIDFKYIGVNKNSSEILSCGCHPILVTPSKEGCCKIVQTIFPHEQIDIKSKHVLDISELWIRMDKKNNNQTNLDSKVIRKSNNITGHRAKTSWDSLKFLPPQLPPFLKDYPYL